MKNYFGNALKTLVLAGAMTFFPYCEKNNGGLEKNHDPLVLSNIHTKTIGSNLDWPGGLSSNENYEGNLKGKSSDFGIMAHGPLWYRADGVTDYSMSVNPKLLKLSGDLEDINLEDFNEFNLEDYWMDFNSPLRFVEGGLSKCFGLTIDNLIEGEGVLTSSNASDKIFKVGSESVEIYLQDWDLTNITDMERGSDGKIYAVQAPWINPRNDSIWTPKRVISIEDKLINVEFEIPTGESSLEFGVGARNYDKLKIVENSEIGKEKFGTKFYVSDLLDNVIYKVSENNKVEVLAKDIRYPSTLAVSENGDIFYTTTAMWDSRSNEIEFPVELRMLNPADGESSLVHSFDGEHPDLYKEGAGIEKIIGGEPYVFPIGLSPSMKLFEEGSRLNFLITNSSRGELSVVSATGR